MSYRQEFGRIVRFGITGVVSTLVHYGAYLLALRWVSATLAYTAGYGVALCLNYLLTTFFTVPSARVLIRSPCSSAGRPVRS